MLFVESSLVQLWSKAKNYLVSYHPLPPSSNWRGFEPTIFRLFALKILDLKDRQINADVLIKLMLSHFQRSVSSSLQDFTSPKNTDGVYSEPERRF
jgi:hypothetical protein